MIPKKEKKKNKQTNFISNEDYKEVFNELSIKYPKLFKNGTIKLLKIGIKQDLIENANLKTSNVKLGKFLRRYTSKSAYRKLHIENAKRYDLYGAESGIVTKKHVEGLARQKTQKKK